MNTSNQYHVAVILDKFKRDETCLPEPKLYYMKSHVSCLTVIPPICVVLSGEVLDGDYAIGFVSFFLLQECHLP